MAEAYYFQITVMDGPRQVLKTKKPIPHPNTKAGAGAIEELYLPGFTDFHKYELRRKNKEEWVHHSLKYTAEIVKEKK